MRPGARVGRPGLASAHGISTPTLREFVQRQHREAGEFVDPGRTSSARRLTVLPARHSGRYDAAVVRQVLPLWFGAAILAASFAAPTGAATRLAPAQEHALRQRALDLFERRERARFAGGVSLADLALELAAVADTLDAVGLDSLAAGAHYRAGGLFVRVGRDGLAHAHLDRSIAAARRGHDRLGELTAISFRADLNAETDPDGTIATIRSIRPRLEALHDLRQLGSAYSTEARAWMALGRARESLVAARRATDYYRRADLPFEIAFALGQQSQALRFLGRHREALQVADSTIALGQRQSIGRGLSRAYRERASCLRTLGRQEEALQALDHAMATDRRLGDSRGQIGARRFKLPILLALGRYRECVLQADTLLEMGRGQSDPTLALTAAMFRSASCTRLGQPADADTTLLPRIDAYEAFRRTFPDDENQAATAELNFAAYAVLARSYMARGRTADAWRACERGRGFALKNRLGVPATPDLDALLARLQAAHAALIQYSNLDTILGSMFVLAGGRVSALPRRIEVTPADLSLAHDRLSSATSLRTDEPILTRLGTALLGDVARLIPGDIRRLIIVPPNGAEDLPFEALAVSTGGVASPVGERWLVSYTPAAGLLPVLDSRAARGSRITALVDPEVSAAGAELVSLDARTRGLVTQPLPNARREGQRLAEAGATVLAGGQATLARLDAETPSGVLHFATHAIEDPRVAPRGGLLLAGTPALLTAAAVESLDVVADLVSLSACRTLGSTRYNGEGAFGLARSFLAAGARTVVTTRWEVGDRAAARVMELFYDGLSDHLARDESLSRAVRQMGREGFTARDRWAFLLLGVGDAPLPVPAGRSKGSGK